MEVCAADADKGGSNLYCNEYFIQFITF
jgi:hypothetical protein